MSDIEERLTGDIAAVTRGVVVTESDLRDARNAVEDRIDSKRRRTVVAVAAAAVVISILGVTAFQTLGGDDKTAPPADQVRPTSPDPDALFLTGSAPSPELLEGVWRVDNGTSLLRFRTDGEVFLDSGGMLYADSVVGTYTIAGDLITVDVQGGPAGCVVPERLVLRASLPEAGALHVVHTEPITGTCISDSYERWVLEQVLPTQEGLAGLDFSGDDFQPLADPSGLHGDWMAQGGGHVLELTSDGTAAPNDGDYYVAAASGDVVDYGRWTFDASRSQLGLVSSGNSQMCDVGDLLVLGELGYVDSFPGAFRGTVEQNTCGGAWTPEVWILLPHTDQ